MKFIKKFSIVTLVLILLLSNLVAKDKKELVFGVIPGAGSESMEDMFENLHKYLSQKLGIKIKLTIAGDYTSVITAMSKKHIDFAYFGPNSYIEATKRANARALVVEVDEKSGLPGYKGIILTKKGSGLKTLEDLKGKIWAFTDPQSTSGTLIPSILFEKQGIDPQKYFKKVIYSGSSEASILSVKSGKINAASNNDLDFDRGLGKRWKKDDFNIIWTSKLIPGAPIAIREDLPESLKDSLQQALIEYKDPIGLKKMKNKGFIKADDSTYDSVRELIKLKEKLKKK